MSDEMSAGSSTPVDTSGRPRMPGGTQAGIVQSERFSRYTILGELGRGGMGVVLSAYDPQLERKVALKLVHVAGGDDDRASRAHRTQLISEARAMARLGHPNVVSIYDIGQHQARVYVAMELIKGESLRQRNTRARLPWPEAVAIMARVARGLAAAHAVGLTHRDVKPDNVLLGDDGRVCITDFGLATDTRGQAMVSERTATNGAVGAADADEAGDLASETTLTTRATNTATTAGVAGTPSYMAPEQHLAMTCDASTDVFGFSVSLFETLYGTKPFDPRAAKPLLEQIRDGDIVFPQPEPPVPAWLKAIVLRGLHYDRETRWASAKELLDQLEQPRGSGLHQAMLVALALVCTLFGVVASHEISAQPSSCTVTDPGVSQAWGPQRVAAVERAFLASEKAFARNTLQKIKSDIERYVERWQHARSDNCRATHVDGRQPHADMLLRDECLARRLQELQALTQVFATADDSAIRKASRAVKGLAPLEACADLDELRRKTQRSLTPRARAWAQRAQADLAQFQAWMEMGQIQRAAPLGESLASAAMAAGHIAKAAELEQHLSQIDYLSGRIPTALERSNLAISLATSAGADDLVSGAVAWQIFAEGYLLANYTRARELIGRARALLTRLGEPADISGAHFMNVGTFHFGRGDIDSAAESYRRALELHEQAFGPQHPKTAYVIGNIGLTEINRGRLESALSYFERAADIMGRSLGLDHPDLVLAIANTAVIHLDLSQPGRALAASDRASRICHAAHGDDGVHCSASEQHGTQALIMMGHWDEARERADSLRIRQERAGRRGPSNAMWSHLHLAQVEHQRGHWPEALALIRDGLDWSQRDRGVDHLGVRSMRALQVRAELALGRPTAARAHLAELASLERATGAGGSSGMSAGAELHSLRAEIALAEGQPEAAHDHYLEALDIHTKATRTVLHRELKLQRLAVRIALALDNAPQALQAALEARKLWHAIPELEPHTGVETRLLLARAQLRNAAFDSARATLFELIESFDPKQRSPHQLASAHMLLACIAITRAPSHARTHAQARAQHWRQRALEASISPQQTTSLRGQWSECRRRAPMITQRAQHRVESLIGPPPPDAPIRAPRTQAP